MFFFLRFRYNYSKILKNEVSRPQGNPINSPRILRLGIQRLDSTALESSAAPIPPPLEEFAPLVLTIKKEQKGKKQLDE